MEKISKIFLSFMVALVGLLFASPVNAAEQQEDVQVDKVNESTMQLKLNDNISFEKGEYGEATLINHENNETEELPQEATDQNGAPVSLVYIKNDDGVEVQVLSQDAFRGVAKCALGTAGGAGSTGLAGAGVGSAVPGIGTTAGAIVGGVSGAMSGAAASCFD